MAEQSGVRRVARAGDGVTSTDHNWQPDIYKDDGEGPARDPTKDESNGVRKLGKHATEVAEMYAGSETNRTRQPSALRTLHCQFEADNGIVCEAPFTSRSGAAKYCEVCKPKAKAQQSKEYEERTKLQRAKR